MLSQNKAFIERWKRAYFSKVYSVAHENLHLAILEAGSGEFCGDLNIQSFESKAPEIGITLLEAKQAKGIAAVAIKLFMDKFIEISELLYFTARIDEENIYSQKMISKLGAEKIMQIRNAYCYKIEYTK